VRVLFGLTLARIAAKFPPAWKYKAVRLRPLYARLMRLGQRTIAVHTQAGQFSWVLDGLSSQEIVLGTYEPYMQEALRLYLKPGGIFYDIGSHAGFHSFFGALLVAPGGGVFAFEPNPGSQQSIERQISANPQLQVTLVRYAALDRCGKVGFEAAPSNQQQGHVVEGGSMEVEARTLDSLVNDGTLPAPSVIKVDVEGSEKPVLLGAIGLIAEHRPVVLCDYNDGATFSTVQKVLQPLGYAVSEGPPIIAVPSSRN
jgi:FkbM family methyltransferase